MPITAFYRDYLRTVRSLPTLYLRQFFQIRARDNFERVIVTRDPRLRYRKLKSVLQELRRLKRANNKDVKAFDRLLSLAYGRTGKLRWELLEPILTDPCGTRPLPLIPACPDTRPPTFSPELTRLLTTASPRMKRPWSPSEFTVPRLMPARFNPEHPDARILGPFSRRREYNLRWRWYKQELKRVQPPLEVLRGTIDAPGRVQTFMWQVKKEDIESVKRERAPASEMLRPMAMQGTGVVKGLLDVVGVKPTTRPPLTRRERKTATPEEVDAATPPPQHPSRWVRRRYRSLLTSIHHLVYVGGVKDLREGDKQKNPFVVTTSPQAFGGDARVPAADATSLAWITPIDSHSVGNGSRNSRRRSSSPSRHSENNDITETSTTV